MRQTPRKKAILIREHRWGAKLGDKEGKMNFNRFIQLERRVICGILLVACVFGVLVSSVYWNRAIAQSTTTEQNFTENITYTFWKHGSIYYSRNSKTEATTSSSNAAALINNALIANDGIFFLYDNNFTISAPLILDSNDYLIGSGKATILFLAPNTDTPVTARILVYV